MRHNFDANFIHSSLNPVHIFTQFTTARSGPTCGPNSPFLIRSTSPPPSYLLPSLSVSPLTDVTKTYDSSSRSVLICTIYQLYQRNRYFGISLVGSPRGSGCNTRVVKFRTLPVFIISFNLYSLLCLSSKIIHIRASRNICYKAT